MVDDQHLTRIQVADGMLQQEAQRADVGPPPVRMVIADESNFVGKEDIETQLLELMVDQGGQHRVPLAGFRVEGFRTCFPGQGQQVGTFLHPEPAAVILAEDIYHSLQSYEKNRNLRKKTLNPSI